MELTSSPPSRARIFVGTVALIGVLVLGAMVLGACSRDHEGRREVASTDCYACHVPEYEATSMPPHEEIFSTACADCHVTEHWVPAVPISHEWFLLQNRHLEPTCTDCHTAGFATGVTPNTCYGCHQPAYEATTMPSHNGYPTDCASCHNDAGWVPSTFMHSWALTGAHITTPCASCHTGDPPVYMGTPTTCVGCHQEDYDTSPFMGHELFPTTCADCHSTDAWMPALNGVHPEDAFNILRGPHQDGDIGCTDCHDPARGSSVAGENTDCVGCHLTDGEGRGRHSLAKMDDKHRDEGDYPFGTTSVNFCLDCHPTGRKD